MQNFSMQNSEGNKCAGSALIPPCLCLTYFGRHGGNQQEKAVLLLLKLLRDYCRDSSRIRLPAAGRPRSQAPLLLIEKSRNRASLVDKPFIHLATRKDEEQPHVATRAASRQGRRRVWRGQREDGVCQSQATKPDALLPPRSSPL
jgi:hypothetical protein